MDFFRFVYYSFEGKNPRCRPWSILRHLRPEPPPLPRLRWDYFIVRLLWGWVFSSNKFSKTLLRPFGSKRAELERCLGGRNNKSFKSLNELAALRQLLMSICLFRLRYTRIEEDSENSTPSKDLLVRNVFEDSSEKTWGTKCGYELARFACRRMFLRIHLKKRLAFSVVGVKIMACPAILKRRRKSSVSATFCLSPLPKIGEGFGEWFEVLLRTRRIRWLWPAASGCKYKLIVF